MAAFQAAVDLGFRYVETDVHATSDGVAIAFHDDEPGPGDRRDRCDRRRCPGRGCARPGSAAPSRCRPWPRCCTRWPTLRVNIDVKSAAADRADGRGDRARGARTTGCWSPPSPTGDGGPRCSRLSPPGRDVAAAPATVRQVPARRPARRTGPVAPGRCGRCDCLQVPERAGSRHGWSTAARSTAAHAAGVQVHVWTVNDPADMHRLLDLGVDGLVTDRADLLQGPCCDERRAQWTRTP